ncbi:hypothetical protein [Xenorhabdus hominickii]|uniref:Uncharacterized protein n=1 Tax=Xenorhabdus hominickii TaxID=351679 RepID=A0A2G0Q710_XENHO|nr:hypothetical protein [Xenorhabdus hominickii]AOM39254.1 hypothetical protein A9255_00650 [Xenorhabdus hominickii]PHM55002.1 hypothetical protein Xhom_02972 [Xenorhabdus hominickii]
MPIIIENEISLIFQDRKFEFATNDGDIECSLDNPYKAAMVIYLHMKNNKSDSELFKSHIINVMDGEGIYLENEDITVNIHD